MRDDAGRSARSFVWFLALAVALGPGCTCRRGVRTAPDASVIEGVSPVDASVVVPVEAASVDTRLFPLEEGRWWDHRYSNPGGPMDCRPGIHRTSVVGTEVRASREAFKVKSACSVQVTPMTLEGDQLDAFVLGAFRPLLQAPLKDGARWPWVNSTMLLKREPQPITVAAGTFDDCWTATVAPELPSASTTYCRGVGIVRMRRGGQRSSFAGSDAELVAASFLP